MKLAAVCKRALSATLNPTKASTRNISRSANGRKPVHMLGSNNMTNVNYVNSLRAALKTRRRQYSTDQTLHTVLSPAQEKLLQEEIVALNVLIKTLESIEASKDDIQDIKKSIEQLKDLFLLVVIGEFNSGKSSFLNAMLGDKFLTEGVTPTTSQVNILRHGETTGSRTVTHISGELNKEELEVLLPVDWLKQISLVDTPGTNAVITEHQQITEHFVPRSDMVLFVTSCDRAFTESERLFLDRVREFKKKVIVIISKIDLLDGEEQLREVVSWVKVQANKLLGMEPLVFPVSSKKALKAKREVGDLKGEQRNAALVKNALWNESRFGALESYILSSLSAQERAQLKMKNPLGVAEHLVIKYVKEVEAREKTLNSDLQVIKRINEELEGFKKDMLRDYSLFEDRVDNVLLRMSERGRDYLDDTLTITRILDLIRTDKTRSDFETKVVGETNAEIDKHVTSLIDWLVEKNAQQWSSIVDFTQRQVAEHSGNLVGNMRTQFNYNRANLIAGIGESAKQVTASFDRAEEAKKLSSEIQTSVFQTAALQVGAVGIVCTFAYLHSEGTLIGMSMLDVTGLLGVGALAALGVGVLPYKRHQMKKNLAATVESLRKSLRNTLRDHFTHEIDKSISDIRSNLAPYTRFVDKEAVALQGAKERLKEAQVQLGALSRDVDSAFKL